MKETEGKRQIYVGFGGESAGRSCDRNCGRSCGFGHRCKCKEMLVNGIRSFRLLEEAVGLEARYAAITGNLSGEERELEENCRKTLSVYEKNEKN